MIEIVGDLWSKDIQFACITTNGIVKENGELVMGKGIALEAARRFPAVPKKLGSLVAEFGNKPFVLHDERLISFPTKHHWRDPSSIELIIRSAKILTLLSKIYEWKRVGFTRPGCGNGQLDWGVVKPAIETILPDCFICVTKDN